MPNSRTALEEIRTELALLQQAVQNLEKSLRVEFNGKHDVNQGDIKELKLAVAKISNSISRVELRIARYAGGAGVLTAIAIKLLDKIKF